MTVKRAILALSCVVALAQPMSAQTGDKTGIVGTWRLISIHDPADSTRYHPRFGPQPKGLLVYSSTGAIAIQIMSDPQPSIAASSRDEITADEALRAMRGYYAFFGRYTLEDGARFQLVGPVIVQQVESSVWPYEVGREYVRPCALAGDTLVLRALQAGGWSKQRWLRVSARPGKDLNP